MFCVFLSRRRTVRICELCAGVAGSEKLWDRNLGTNKVSAVYRTLKQIFASKCH